MSKKSLSILFTSLTILLIVSCSSKTFSDKEELLAYINEPANGFTQHKTVNGVDFTLTYRPTDILVKQELGDNIDAKRIEALRDKYNKYLYFNLSMSVNNQELLSVAPKNRQEFGAMVNQLVFGMHEKVHMYTQNKDTLPMVDYVYPRMYGMGRATNMLFVYPKKKDVLQTNDLHFTIQDIGLFTGEVKFKIELEKINNQPQITYN